MASLDTCHAGAPARPGLAGLLRSLTRLPLIWAKRMRDRRQLFDLLGQSEHMIRDIGVSRADLMRESMKPFWMP